VGEGVSLEGNGAVGAGCEPGNDRGSRRR
jgi:hypothetical protein